MKKILIIANFTCLPWENGNSRFIYLANLLYNEGYEIELVTSTFSHGQKKQRKSNKEKWKEKINYDINLIYEPGYKKNISLKRIYSHYIFSKNLKKYLNIMLKPDIIYCAVPSLDVAKVAAKFSMKNNIKFILDIQDLWPEAFKMIVNVPVISNLIFYPMKKEVDYIYKQADDIVAVSETYLNRAMKVNKKARNKLSVFLGTDLEYFDNCKKENQINKSDNIFRIAYIGTLGHSYDIKSVIDAIKILNKKEIKNIKFEVMGNGPLENEFKEYAEKNNINAKFYGKLKYPEMVGKLCSCDIAVNPIKKGSAGSIINKVGDYAAAGIPVINTQECEEYKKLVETYNIGFNCKNGNPEEIANRIEQLYIDKELRFKLGTNNRILAEEKFDRKKTYKKIINMIEED